MVPLLPHFLLLPPLLLLPLLLLIDLRTVLPLEDGEEEERLRLTSLSLVVVVFLELLELFEAFVDVEVDAEEQLLLPLVEVDDVDDETTDEGELIDDSSTFSKALKARKFVFGFIFIETVDVAVEVEEDVDNEEEVVEVL